MEILSNCIILAKCGSYVMKLLYDMTSKVMDSYSRSIGIHLIHRMLEGYGIFFILTDHIVLHFGQIVSSHILFQPDLVSDILLELILFQLIISILSLHLIYPVIEDFLIFPLLSLSQ